MGIVVIHAGMPKTGSSSLQAWLAEQAHRLRGRFDVQVLVAGIRSGNENRGGLVLAAPRFPRLEAGRLAKLYDAWGRDRQPEIDESLLAQLDARAERARITVISSEALAGRFHRLDGVFLGRLSELGQRHEVRVAYYVRPQHTALEAAWRQWGFRSDQPPSDFVRRRSRQLDHFRTWRGIRPRAPSVSFEVRPFRTDLLWSGSLVDDFAQHFLGVQIERVRDRREPLDARVNRGLPLDLVNALGALPAGILWSGGHGNRRLNAVKPLLARLEVPESETVRRSRTVLQAYAHRTFEDGNRRLISALGWPTAAFVPPVDAGAEGDVSADVSELDELWAPEAARAELGAAVARAVFGERGRAAQPP